MQRTSKGSSTRDSGEFSARRTIRSWAELQAEAPAIVERANSDQQLAIAGAANPMLMLEELGYDFDERTRREIEARLRYGPKRQIRVRRTEEQIASQFGADFNPMDDQMVLTLLSGTPKIKKGVLPDEDLDALLEKRARHDPAFRALAEHRRLVRNTPDLAPRSVYLAIRSGELRVPVTRLRARFKQSGSGEERSGRPSRADPSATSSPRGRGAGTRQ